MLESIIGGILGGAARMVPEVLNFMDKKNERAHELALQDKQIEFQKIAGNQKMAELGAQADLVWDQGSLEVFKEAIEAQGKKSGVRIIDGLNASVRPVICYAYFGLYVVIKLNTLFTAPDWASTIPVLWNDFDQAQFSAILSFFFLNRIIKNRAG